MGWSVSRWCAGPPSNVLTVHALNRGADEVLRLAERASEHGRVSVSTGELASLVDPEHEQQVAKDVDEALWEEVETRLRHQSRTTANYLLLMALGGAIAASGFAVHQPTEQALSFVAGAIVAPGFEPLANVSVGLALRRRGLVARALGSAALGYLVLILSAALLFVVLRLTGAVTVGGYGRVSSPPTHTLKSARSRLFIVFMNRLRSSRPLSLSWGLRIWPAPFSGSTASTRLEPSSS
jgi:hypothetical protein